MGCTHVFDHHPARAGSRICERQGFKSLLLLAAAFNTLRQWIGHVWSCITGAGPHARDKSGDVELPFGLGQSTKKTLRDFFLHDVAGHHLVGL